MYYRDHSRTVRITAVLLLALILRSAISARADAARDTEPGWPRNMHQTAARPDVTAYVPLVAHGVRLQRGWVEAGRLNAPPWPDDNPFPLHHLATNGRFACGLRVYIDWKGVEQLHNGTLYCANVADPANPAWLGQSQLLPLGRVRDGSRLYTVLDGARAYIVAGTAGIHVLDVADPSRPRFLATVPAERSVNAIQISGRLAYVADTCVQRSSCQAAADGAVGRLRILDLADPDRPRELGRLALTAPAPDLAFGAGRVFVASPGDGVKAVDVTDPAHPRPLATYHVVPWLTRLAVRDRQLLVLHYQAPPLHEPPTLTRLDVTDVLHPILRDQVPLPASGYLADKSTELVLGDTALIVVRPDHRDRRWAIDWFELTDDRAPLVRDVYWHPGAWAVPTVAVTGDILLVADADLRFLRLTPAEIPQP